MSALGRKQASPLNVRNGWKADIGIPLGRLYCLQMTSRLDGRARKLTD